MHSQSVLKIKHPKLESGPRMLIQTVIRDQLMGGNPVSHSESIAFCYSSCSQLLSVLQFLVFKIAVFAVLGPERIIHK